jgi:hypothetical protein
MQPNKIRRIGELFSRIAAEQLRLEKLREKLCAHPYFQSYALFCSLCSSGQKLILPEDLHNFLGRFAVRCDQAVVRRFFLHYSTARQL